MFIVWGEKVDYKNRGVVADACPVCVRPRVFSVRDVSTATHIYYVAIGGWSNKGPQKFCWGCQNSFYADLEDYVDFIPDEDADGMTVREIARRTNPPLAEWIARRTQNGPEIEAQRAQPTNERIAPSRIADSNGREDGTTSDRRPKIDYSHRRLLCQLLFLSGLACGALCGGLAAYFHQEYEKYRDGPKEITAVELLEQGPGDAKYVTVTGLQFGTMFWQEGGKGSEELPQWLVAASVEDSPLEEPGNLPPNQLLVIRLKDTYNGNHLANIAPTGKVTGTVDRGDPPIPGNARRFLEGRYQGSNLGNAWVVREYQPPKQELIWSLVAVAGGSALVMVVAAGYFLWLRSAEKQEQLLASYEDPNR